MARSVRKRKKKKTPAGKLRIADHWNAISIIASSQANPLKAVAEFVENSIDAGAKHVVIVRGRKKGEFYLKVSDDGGGSWGQCLDDPTLIEPVCQASLLRYSWGEAGDRGRLLFSNPASTTARDHMTLRISADDGTTWPFALEIHAGSSAYSSLTRLPDASVGVLYERDDYGEIAFTRIELPVFDQEGSAPR